MQGNGIVTNAMCMLFNAQRVAGLRRPNERVRVAVYYLATFIGLNIAVANAGLTPFYQQMIRAMWIGYCIQASLLGLLFIVAALRPRWISRPLIVHLRPVAAGRGRPRLLLHGQLRADDAAGLRGAVRAGRRGAQADASRRRRRHHRHGERSRFGVPPAAATGSASAGSTTAGASATTSATVPPP